MSNWLLDQILPPSAPAPAVDAYTPPEGEINVLLLAGVHEELKGFFKEHPFVFRRDLRAYRSLKLPGLYAMTTGPGVRRKRELRRALEKLQPGVLINVGLVGMLDERDTIKPGEALKLGMVLDHQKNIRYPGGKGSDVLVTVDRPVFDPMEKMNLYLDKEARACDMEAARVIELVGAMEKLSLVIEIVIRKVAGDLPSDYFLFRDEHLIRNWDRLSFLERLKTTFQFPGGPPRLLRLFAAKRRALKGLTREIHQVVQEVLESRGNTEKLDGVFIPH